MLFGCVYLRTSLGKSWIIFAGRTTQFPSINSQFFFVQTDFFWKKKSDIFWISVPPRSPHPHFFWFDSPAIPALQRFPKNPPSKPQRADPGSTDPSYPRQCDWTHPQETWRLTHQQKIWSNINRWSFLFVSGKIVVFRVAKISVNSNWPWQPSSFSMIAMGSLSGCFHTGSTLARKRIWVSRGCLRHWKSTTWTCPTLADWIMRICWISMISIHAQYAT